MDGWKDDDDGEQQQEPGHRQDGVGRSCSATEGHTAPRKRKRRQEPDGPRRRPSRRPWTRMAISKETPPRPKQRGRGEPCSARWRRSGTEENWAPTGRGFGRFGPLITAPGSLMGSTLAKDGRGRIMSASQQGRTEPRGPAWAGRRGPASLGAPGRGGKPPRWAPGRARRNVPSTAGGNGFSAWCHGHRAQSELWGSSRAVGESPTRLLMITENTTATQYHDALQDRQVPCCRTAWEASSPMPGRL